MVSTSAVGDRIRNIAIARSAPSINCGLPDRSRRMAALACPPQPHQHIANGGVDQRRFERPRCELFHEWKSIANIAHPERHDHLVLGLPCSLVT